MVRLGGAASPNYVGIFRGLQAHFLRHGIELDWVIYSDYDALVLPKSHAIAEHGQQQPPLRISTPGSTPSTPRSRPRWWS